MLESTIEKKVCDYAKSKGMYVKKFTSTNSRAVPDRILIYHGMTFFIEFKAPGKKPSTLQEREARIIRSHGCQVLVVDDVAFGKCVIDKMVRVKDGI